MIGIPSNLDQCLNMAAINALGAGKLLRPRNVNPRDFPRQVEELIKCESYGQAARMLASESRLDASTFLCSDARRAPGLTIKGCSLLHPGMPLK